MNKYDKEIIEQEIKPSEEEKIYKSQILSRIKQKLFELNTKSYQTIEPLDDEELFCIIILKINTMDDKSIDVILEELKNSTFCKHSALLSCLRELNCIMLKNKPSLVEGIIESMKIHNLIQDIVLHKEGIYELITSNHNNVPFTQAWGTYEAARKATAHCHSATRSFLASDKHCIAEVCKMKTYFGREMYHSYIIQNENIHDLSMNLIMPQDNYKMLFQPKPIATFDQNEFYLMLEQLKKDDKDFTTTTINKHSLLKCAMAHQMQKQKRYYQ